MRTAAATICLFHVCAHTSPGHQTDGTSIWMPCTQCCPTHPVDGSQCQERLLISSAPFRCGHGHVQDSCSLLGASKAPLLRMAWLLSSCSAGTRGAGPTTGARLQHCHADKNCTSVTAADTRALHPGLTPTCISARTLFVVAEGYASAVRTTVAATK